jgi:hypothetical protein
VELSRRAALTNFTSCGSDELHVLRLFGVHLCGELGLFVTPLPVRCSGCVCCRCARGFLFFIFYFYFYFLFFIFFTFLCLGTAALCLSW